MSFSSLKSLRFKIIVPTIFMTLVVGFTSVEIFSSSMKKSVFDEFRSKGQALAKSLANSAQDTLLNRDASTIQSFIDDYRKISGVGFVYVQNADGRVLAHTFSPAFPNDLTRHEDHKQNEVIVNIQTREFEWRGRSYLDISAPILGGSLGFAHVGMDATEILSDISKIARNAELIISAIILFGSIVIYLFLNSHVQAIIALSSYTKKVSQAKDMTRAIEEQGVMLIFSGDELGELAASFNKMMQQIQFHTVNLEKLVIERSEGLDQARSVLVQSSKLASLGEMAGGVAHEINNPLAIIKNLSVQIREILGDETLDKVMLAEMVAKVEKTTDRIAKIVLGLKSFSRDGSHDPFGQVNLNMLIDETLSFCKERFKNNGTKLTVDSPSKDLTIEARATEISQILLNLLNNANDAIEEKSDKWIHVGVLEKDENVQIQITDCGNGISAEIQKKLFQPFFTTKEIGKGTGLGLSISIGIAKGHGGKIWLDQQCPNTRFVVELPKQQTKSLARVA